MSTDTVPQTDRISFFQAAAIVLDTHHRKGLPFPYVIGQNERGDNDLLVLRFNSIADMRRWITEVFHDEREPVTYTRGDILSSSTHIRDWRGWTVALEASDPLHVDAEQDTAALLEAAADAVDENDEITCGRCAIAVGAHTFGRGCNAQLVSPPVFLDPSGTPKHAARPELLHVVGPEDVAPGEPDDRGWDAPITPAYIDAHGHDAA